MINWEREAILNSDGYWELILLYKQSVYSGNVEDKISYLLLEILRTHNKCEQSLSVIFLAILCMPVQCVSHANRVCWFMLHKYK